MGNDIMNLKLEGVVMQDVMDGYQSFISDFFGKFFCNNRKIQGNVDFSSMDTLKK